MWTNCAVAQKCGQLTNIFSLYQCDEEKNSSWTHCQHCPLPKWIHVKAEPLVGTACRTSQYHCSYMVVLESEMILPWTSERKYFFRKTYPRKLSSGRHLTKCSCLVLYQAVSAGRNRKSSEYGLLWYQSALKIVNILDNMCYYFRIYNVG